MTVFEFHMVSKLIHNCGREITLITLTSKSWTGCQLFSSKNIYTHSITIIFCHQWSSSPATTSSILNSFSNEIYGIISRDCFVRFGFIITGINRKNHLLFIVDIISYIVNHQTEEKGVVERHLTLEHQRSQRLFFHASIYHRTGLNFCIQKGRCLSSLTTA